MTTLLNRIILLNVELEGALRVCANRPSEEALENAKKKFAEISALFAMINPVDLLAETDRMTTVVKEAEADAGESDPMPEPQPADREMLEQIIMTEYEKETEPVEAECEPAAHESAETERSVEPEKPRPEGKTFEIRREPADIRKMFTLNDKFLFKRELFGNNSDEFNATLELFASMHSFGEAEEYAYDDLQWDRSDARVRDFMNVIQTYFTERLA